MGSQVSTIKAVLSPEGRKKVCNKNGKAKIGILSFEVANVLSKIIQLWQSLSDNEVVRLRTEVVKAEGVRNLVSDNEAVLLSLACMEKLQDLTGVAGAVIRLGRSCHELVLQDFDSVYNDMLKNRLDVHTWQFSPKEMKLKIKKMEQYIASTSNLYQELEILGDLEVASRRIHDDGSGSARDRETLLALEQKAAWHRQEVKYLRDYSLWNRTYDSVVTLMARTVFTIHGRILNVFESPILGLPQLCPIERRRDLYVSTLRPEILPPSVGMHHLSPCCGHERSHDSRLGAGSYSPGALDRSQNCGLATNSVSNSSVSRVSPLVSDLRPVNLPSLSPSAHAKKNNPFYYPIYQHCLHSHTKSIADYENPLDDQPSRISNRLATNPWSNISHLDNSQTVGLRSSVRISGLGSGQWQTDLFSATANTRKIFFDPKSKHLSAPSSTLGGAALALHYANVIIIIEKMIKFPHLISHDARDDLYHMLPTAVRKALRSRLRSAARKHDGFDSSIAGDWKDALERILAWLTPLAHNMIRWQSEHNFEQQQVVARSNILLLQTLYLADVIKCETAIGELLVGLNYLCGHEKERSQNVSAADGKSQKDAEDYLEWQF